MVNRAGEIKYGTTRDTELVVFQNLMIVIVFFFMFLTVRLEFK